ncbi:hypothetical protein GCM10008967_09950 [Bacillus carboniphilus]|uniref:Uncharacterized protein n=1 Tax=Bacillus carboniphilus TaxID=86663 RepID=A0ABN0VZS8_9BACI
MADWNEQAAPNNNLTPDVYKNAKRKSRPDQKSKNQSKANRVGGGD